MTVVAPDDRADAGDTIDYTLTATNTGNTTLNGVTIADPKLGDAVVHAGAAGDARAGRADGRARAAYTLTQADIDAGGVDNTATATATDAADGGVETGAAAAGAGADAGQERDARHDRRRAETRADAGDRVDYTLTADERRQHDAHRRDGRPIRSWARSSARRRSRRRSAPGEQIVCTGSYTLTQADIEQRAGRQHGDGRQRRRRRRPRRRAPSRCRRRPRLSLAKSGTLDLTVVEPATAPTSATRSTTR